MKTQIAENLKSEVTSIPKLISRTGICFMLTFLFSGCFSSDQTRLPSWGVNSPNVERREYQKHDPYPDTSYGPDLQTRPREFSTQRTETRRAVENRTLLGTPPNTPSSLPSTNQEYPLSVP